MSDQTKTSDVRTGLVASALTELRLFCEVEAVALSGVNARALETRMRDLITIPLVASGIRMVETAAAPGLFATVTARVVHVNALAVALVIRIDLAIREEVTVDRLPAPGKVVAETWSHRPDVLICAGKQPFANVKAAVETVLNKQVQALIADKANRNPVGDEVVAAYFAEGVHNPGGDPAALAHQRLSAAYAKVCGAALPALGDGSDFDRLWNSKVDPKASWLLYGPEIRARGAAGALVSIAKGQAVDQAGIWQLGLLKPGALLHVWLKEGDFIRVSAGDPPQSLGHTMIFLRYVVEGEKIAGMRIADQGMLSSQVIRPTDFEFWSGANPVC